MTQKIYINPPPGDGCCECCRINAKKLKPFGKAGDPLVGDFDGQILIKTFRTMCPIDKKLDEEVNKIKDWDKFFEEHPKRAEELSFYDQLLNTVEARWLCRDCIILNDEDYFKKRSGKNNEYKSR